MSTPTLVFQARSVRAGLLCCLLAAAAVLSACGGASESSSANPSEQRQQAATEPTFLPSSDEPPSAQTIALQEEGGRLNQQELQAIAKTATLPPTSGGPSLSGVPTQASRKAGGGSGAAAAAAVTKTAAYRFFNTRTGAHFYTTSTAERDDVLRRFPFMNLDGAAFDVSASALTVLSPVYRFYNTRTGVHFYTISEAEKQHIIANLKSFNFEGVAYHASVLPGTGYTPLYRFFLPSRGYHFYTASQQERDHIIANLRQYTYEGIGYYVLDSQWRRPDVAPITEAIHDVCLQAGTNAPLSCTNPATAQLYPQQDGHRLPPFDPVNNPLIKLNSVGVVKDTILPECVFDESTGLLWENHTASPGIHSVKNRFTNLNNGEDNDTSGHIAAVNAARLCGHDDWRLPTLQELHTLMDYGVKADVFGRSALKQSDSYELMYSASPYWSSTSSNTQTSETVLFAEPDRIMSGHALQSSLAVRLVRGVVWQGPRYVLSTKAFGADANNNVVIDRKTGLIWRRCIDELTWDGSVCTGLAVPRKHEQALLASKTVLENYPGWRMPNIQELFSVFGPTSSRPLDLDPAFFVPVVGGERAWATTLALYSPASAPIDAVYLVKHANSVRVWSWVRSVPQGGSTRYLWTAN
jgi:hypothetical protein